MLPDICYTVSASGNTNLDLKVSLQSLLFPLVTVHNGRIAVVLLETPDGVILTPPPAQDV